MAAYEEDENVTLMMVTGAAVPLYCQGEDEGEDEDDDEDDDDDDEDKDDE